MTDPTTSSPATPARRPTRRSPSYPAINLETAIRRAREIYAREREYSTSVQTIAAHWGYKSLNGPAHLTLAALKKFGLMTDEGKASARRARLTDLAVDILEHPDDRVREEAIKQAALSPAIYRELWEKYGDAPPSDVNLRWILTRERGFSETGAAEFIPRYKETVAFAKLDFSDALPTQVAGSEDQGGRAFDEDDPEPPAGRRSNVRDPGVTSYNIPIFDGRVVIVEGQFPLSEEDWNQFMTVLSVYKPALVARPREDRILGSD
jgi:hypothetical protein